VISVICFNALDILYDMKFADQEEAEVMETKRQSLRDATSPVAVLKEVIYCKNG
jgi:hypothetical protein